MNLLQVGAVGSQMMNRMEGGGRRLWKGMQSLGVSS